MIDPVIGMLPAGIKSTVDALPSSSRARFIKFALRVVGGPNVAKWLDAYEQSKLDDEGRAIFNRKLAERAGETAAADPATLERYMARKLDDAIAGQRNLEAIVGRAAEEVLLLTQEATPEPEVNEPEAADEKPAEVSDDWRRKFTFYAEEISDPDLQVMWARMLAGEFRKPGSFSYRTLRAISELDPAVAALFQRVAGDVFLRSRMFAPPNIWNSGKNLQDFLTLKDWGFLNGDVGRIGHTLHDANTGGFILPGDSAALVVILANKPAKLSVPVVELTSLAKETLALLGPYDDTAVMRRMGEYLKPAKLVPGDLCNLMKWEIGPGGKRESKLSEWLWLGQ